MVMMITRAKTTFQIVTTWMLPALRVLKASHSCPQMTRSGDDDDEEEEDDGYDDDDGGDGGDDDGGKDDVDVDVTSLEARQAYSPKSDRSI